MALRDPSKHYQWPRATAHDPGNASGFATPGGECPGVPVCNRSNQCSHLLLQPGACLLGPQWPIKNHGTMHCTSRWCAQPSALAPAINPLGWILPVLLLPLMENKVGPRPGRVRTKSLNDTHRSAKTLPLVDPLTTQKHGSSTSVESDDDSN